MKNIAYAKFGKSILFDKKKWGPIGGDCEGPALLFALAKHNPDTTFWIIGKSDFSRVYPNGLDEFPNIKDIWHNQYWDNGISPNSYAKDIKSEEAKKYFTYLNDAFARIDVKIDYALLLSGLTWNAHIPKSVIKVDGTNDFCGVLEAAVKYSAHIFQFLNDTDVHWDLVCTDPRQYRCYAKEMNNLPQRVYSQAVDMWLKKGTYICWPPGIKSSTTRDVVTEYGYSELINLLSRQPNQKLFDLDEEYLNNKSGFNIIMNEGHPGTKSKKFQDAPRYIDLKKYILKEKDFDVSIYGKWPEEIMAIDERFKGTIQPQNLGDILHTTKYTFCIPIKDKWTTSKFLEMCHFGVIPFLHPTYARTLDLKYINSFFYVNSFEEMQQKVAKLESDKDFYMKAVKILRDTVFPNDSYKYYDGTFLSNFYSFVRPEIFAKVEYKYNSNIADVLDNLPVIEKEEKPKKSNKKDEKAPETNLMDAFF